MGLLSLFFGGNGWGAPAGARYLQKKIFRRKTAPAEVPNWRDHPSSHWLTRSTTAPAAGRRSSIRHGGGGSSRRPRRSFTFSSSDSRTYRNNSFTPRSTSERTTVGVSSDEKGSTVVQVDTVDRRDVLSDVLAAVDRLGLKLKKAEVASDPGARTKSVRVTLRADHGRVAGETLSELRERIVAALAHGYSRWRRERVDVMQWLRANLSTGISPAHVESEAARAGMAVTFAEADDNATQMHVECRRAPFSGTLGQLAAALGDHKMYIAGGWLVKTHGGGLQASLRVTLRDRALPTRRYSEVRAWVLRKCLTKVLDGDEGGFTSRGSRKKEETGRTPRTSFFSRYRGQGISESFRSIRARWSASRR